VPTLFWMKASGKRAAADLVCELLHVADDVHDPRVPAAGEDDDAAAADVRHQRLVVEDQRVGLPAAFPVGLVDRARVELEPAHVLDEAIRREASVEQDADDPPRLLDLDQAGEAVFPPERVAGLARLEEARRDRGFDRARDRPPLRRALVRQQEVGDVVDQRRDRQRVDRLEWD
jgi:hypothetical protein